MWPEERDYFDKEEHVDERRGPDAMADEERYVPACEEDAPEIARLEDEIERLKNYHASYSVEMSERLRVANSETAAVRELMNVYNIGGWTDAVEPMRRAIRAEAENARLCSERDEAVKANLNNVNAYAWRVKELRELLVRCREELWLAGAATLASELDTLLVDGGGQ